MSFVDNSDDPFSVAAKRIRSSVIRPTSAPQLPIQGQQQPTTYIIEPDLMETQTGNQHLPNDVAFDDAGFAYNTITGNPVQIVRRPNVLPIAKTPEGFTFAMPKMLDIAGNVMSPLAAGRVPVKAGEVVLGSGAVRKAVEAGTEIKPMEVFYLFTKQNTPYEVLKNPSSKDIRSLGKDYPSMGRAEPQVRTYDAPDGNRYVWPAAYATHDDVIKSLNLPKYKEFMAGRGKIGGGDLSKILYSDTRPQVTAAVGHAIEKNQPFYSALERTVENAKISKASPEQWLGYLRNQPGVRQEELAYVLKDLPEGQISKETLSDIIKNNKVELKEVVKGKGIKGEFLTPDDAGYDPYKIQTNTQTKYHDYQLPGASNYQEMLLTLPVKTSPKAQEAFDLTKRMNNGEFNSLDDKARKELFAKRDKLLQEAKLEEGSNYKSSHWDEPNILAHVRYNDRNIPVSFTPEEQNILKAHEDAAPKLAQLKQAQADIGKQINQISKPLEAARRSQILADLKAGKISNGDAMRKLENYESPLDIKPLQDKLSELRQQESDLIKSLGEKPTARFDKSLHLEEIQSDWHQAGRKQGYKNDKIVDPTSEFKKVENELNLIDEKYPYNGDVAFNKYLESLPKEVSDKYKFLSQEQMRLRDEVDKFNRIKANENADNRVPDAPFKKTWDELAFKRMLHKAAVEGYDSVSWTPGEAQAARYDLSKQLKELQYLKHDDGTYEIAGITKNGEGFNHPDKVTSAKLPDIVGKDIAEKIIKNEGKRARGHPQNGGYFEGIDLKIGGEGMKSFYDKMLVDKASSLIKKYGGKVEKKNVNGVEIPYIKLTPELKEKAKAGFPLFSSVPITVPVSHNPFASEEKKSYTLVPVNGNPFQ